MRTHAMYRVLSFVFFTETFFIQFVRKSHGKQCTEISFTYYAFSLELRGSSKGVELHSIFICMYVVTYTSDIHRYTRSHLFLSTHMYGE